MARITGPITLGSSGTKTFNGFGFQPTWAEFRVCQKAGTAQNLAHYSHGDTDGYWQNVTSVYQDGTGGKSITDTGQVGVAGKVISHYDRDANGNLVEVLSATLHSFTASGLKLNVTIGNPTYQVILTAGT